MKKEKNFLKWAGVFVAALFVLSAASAIVNAWDTTAPMSSLESHLFPPDDEYEEIWADTYYDAITGLDITSDKDDNCIVVGINDALEGVVVKYDGMTGEVIWGDILDESLVLGGGGSYPLHVDIGDFYCIRDLLFDINQERFDPIIEPTDTYSILISSVDTDSEGDIVIVATAYDDSDEDMPSAAYVAKYRGSDGELMWDRVLDLYIWDVGSSVAFNENDDVIVVGVGGGIQINGEDILPIMDGWMYELNADYGYTSDMNHVFGILQPLPYYFDVAIDTNNNIFATGAYLDIDWSNFPDITAEQSVFVSKHSGYTLNLVNSYLGDPDIYTWLQTIAVDTNDEVYVGGYINNPYSSQYIIKFTNDLNTILWDKQSETGEVLSIATSKEPAIDQFAVQVSNFYDEAFITDLYALSGTFLLEIVECLDEGRGSAVTYDTASDIFVTGGIEGGYEEYMHTMKYHIIPSTILILL